MEIPKAKVLEMLHEQDKGDQAKQQLPDQVDPERDAGLLQKLGLNPQEVMGKLGESIHGL